MNLVERCAERVVLGFGVGRPRNQCQQEGENAGDHVILPQGSVVLAGIFFQQGQLDLGVDTRP